MLSRTADSLYWVARYMERAENTARMLDVALRMPSLSADESNGAGEWHSTIVASGCEKSFYDAHERAGAATVIDHLARDQKNPSSILSCLETARRSSRAVRTALTADMWDAVNATWLEARRLRDGDFAPENIRRFLDWVKERSQLFGGAVANTMLRKDSYWFVRLGTFVERGDNTARILDVKYHVLLPTVESVGGGVDYHQWAAILRSVSALRAYHSIYRDRVKPWRVAELLILRPEMPRSLCKCLEEITRHLDLLSADGTKGECHRLAGQMHARLKFSTIEQVFQSGLHEFLTEFIDTNTTLGNEIAEHYLF
jgi:uncharacterized alpha-E superfamily protein